jgi:hypothetical protein
MRLQLRFLFEGKEVECIKTDRQLLDSPMDKRRKTIFQEKAVRGVNEQGLLRLRKDTCAGVVAIITFHWL